jgi:hypothetical protein
MTETYQNYRVKYSYPLWFNDRDGYGCLGTEFKEETINARSVKEAERFVKYGTPGISCLDIAIESIVLV